MLHLAGDTSLLSVRGVRRTNIEGTLALANRMRRAATGPIPSCRHGLHLRCTRRVWSAKWIIPTQMSSTLSEYMRVQAECELLLESGFSICLWSLHGLPW